MKKIHITLIGLLGLMLSGTASAVNLTTGGSTDITLVTCPNQLANDIKIVLSSGVAGSVDCGTDTVYMSVSVCHTTGLTSSRSYSTSITSAACATQGGTYDTSTAKCNGTTTGAAYPTATTAQGTVGSRYPGSACSTANAATEATAAINEIP